MSQHNVYFTRGGVNVNLKELSKTLSIKAFEFKLSKACTYEKKKVKFGMREPKSDPIKVFRHSPDKSRLYIPRSRAIDLLCSGPNPFNIVRLDGEEVGQKDKSTETSATATTTATTLKAETNTREVVFPTLNVVLSELQENAVSAFCEQIFQDGIPSNGYRRDGRHLGGLIHLPCGVGKTLIALFLTTLIKRRTLFVVHTRKLRDQTINEGIYHFGKDLVCDFKHRNKPKNKNCLFWVTTYQNLSRKTKDLEVLLKDVDFMIFDEAHTMCANKNSAIMLHVGVPIVLGITATTSRSDGVFNILPDSVGPAVFTSLERTWIAYSDVFMREFSPKWAQEINRLNPEKANPRLEAMDMMSRDLTRAQMVLREMEKILKKFPEPDFVKNGLQKLKFHENVFCQHECCRHKKIQVQQTCVATRVVTRVVATGGAPSGALSDDASNITSELGGIPLDGRFVCCKTLWRSYIVENGNTAPTKILEQFEVATKTDKPHQYVSKGMYMGRNQILIIYERTSHAKLLLEVFKSAGYNCGILAGKSSDVHKAKATFQFAKNKSAGSKRSFSSHNNEEDNDDGDDDSDDDDNAEEVEDETDILARMTGQQTQLVNPLLIAGECQILFGQRSVVTEGLNLPSLTNAIFASPISDVINGIPQCAGRVKRTKFSDDKKCQIVYIQDIVNVFSGSNKKSKDYFKSDETNTMWYVNSSGELHGEKKRGRPGCSRSSKG